jgi:D-beta-D-heptose 7-phosphate kinase/D-beta-D-heptose 1-phosphate adenosyltransferase
MIGWKFWNIGVIWTPMVRGRHVGGSSAAGRGLGLAGGFVIFLGKCAVLLANVANCVALPFARHRGQEREKVAGRELINKTFTKVPKTAFCPQEASMQSILDRAVGIRAVVLGDLFLDHYVMGDAGQLSVEAPVPVVGAREDIWLLGGAANVALNLKTFGALVEVVGPLGMDAAGDRLQNLLVDNKILFDTRLRTNDVQTIVKTRIMAKRQQLCRVDRGNMTNNTAFERAMENLDDILQNTDLLILSDHAKGALTQHLVDSAIEIAHRNSCFVAADPNPQHKLRYAGVDLITPSANEALEMAEMEREKGRPVDWQDVCKKIYQLHAPKYLVITLSDQGMLLCKDGQVLRQVPTSVREVFDISGAGDTVISAISISLAVGKDLEEAARFANTAAGIVVGKFGTAVATPAEIINAAQEAKPGRSRR